MASTYTDLLRLTKPTDGELVGTWGQTVNNGITELEEDAIAGTATVAMADVATTTLTVVNGATDQARCNTLRLTGALTAQRDVVCPSVSKNYFVRNATTGGFGVQVKTAAGTGIVVPNGQAMLLYCDGTNVVQAVTSEGSITVTDINGTPDLILKASGTERMRVRADGNVGIGITPNAWWNGRRGLQLGSPTNADGSLMISPGTVNYVELSSNVYTDASQLLRYVNAGTGTQYAQTNGQHVWGSAVSGTAGAVATIKEWMRINDTGNVGIGVTNPARKLDILSTAGVTPLAAVGPSGSLLIDNVGSGENYYTANSLHAFATGTPNTERMRIDSGGNVGIGTSSPNYALDVIRTQNSDTAIAVGNGSTGANSSASFRFGNAVASAALTFMGSANAAGAGANSLNVYTNNAASLAFGTNGVERMRIDTSGNVVIAGTASPLAAANRGLLTVNGASTAFVGLSVSGTNVGYFGAGVSNTELASLGYQTFITAGTERMRILSGGDVCIGTSSGIGVGYKLNINAGGSAIGTNTPNNSSAAAFYNAGTFVGNIFVAGSTTAYNTSSDYRLKDAVEDLQGSGNFIDALRPRAFTWKADGKRSAGFIAHEFAEVSPSSVSGEKDAVDKDGKLQIQSMQASSSEVMANIIAELQSLRQRVAALGG
jgi:hypothetical protein